MLIKMLTLSGTTDLIVLSVGLTSHFGIKSQNTKHDLSYNFFELLRDLSFYLHAGLPWLMSYKQQCLALF